MSGVKLIFVDDDEFGLAAYDADDGLSKQMALRFTVWRAFFVQQWSLCKPAD